MAAPSTDVTNTGKICITRGLQQSTAGQIALDHVSTLQFISMVSNSYEITSENYNRPYGDVDLKNTPYIDEVTFNEQDRLIGLALHNTIAHLKFSIMKSSSFKYKKISWRFVIKGWKGTKGAIRQFMVETNPVFQEHQCRLGVLHPVSLDLSIYDKNRKMRMLFSSKDGEDRPLTLVEGKPEDTLITYIPSDVIHQELPEPGHAEGEQETWGDVVNGVSTQHSFEECEALMDALLVNRTWVDTYEGARNTIWAFWRVEQSERMYKLLSKLARSGAPSKDDVMFLRTVTKEYKPSQKPVTLATVFWKLKELNPAGLADVRARFRHTYVNEIVGYCRPADWPVYDKWQLPSGYLKDLPIDEHSTILVDSHLGTGKTTQLKRIVAANANKRIILISARRTFTAAMFADWGEKNGFINYRDVKGSLSNYQKVFVQVESLWRLFASEESTSVTAFDIVLMDEVESILAQCSPSPTHQGNYLRNMDVLGQITSGAGKLIAMDAFVTERSIEFLNGLRGGVALVHNPHQPYNRVAIKAPCNNIHQSTSHFWRSVLEAVTAGKRVVIPCGSQKQGLAFEKLLLAHKISYLFYHSTDDRTMRKETLQDVNRSWADVQVLLYTPSIKIGINYDSTEHQFDQMFMYASAGGGIPRDMFQGSLRARVVKDNTMVYCLDSRAIRPSLLGLEAIQAAHEFKTLATLSHLGSVGLSTAHFITLPDWNKALIYRNTNEKNVSIVEFEAVYGWYMAKCGYTVQVQEFEEKVDYETDVVPLFKNVIQITSAKARAVEEAARNELPVSAADKHSLCAYYLCQAVPYFNDLDCSEAQQELLWQHWNDKVVGRNHIKNVMAEAKSIKQLLKREARKAGGCVDLMSQLAERAHIIQGLLTLLDGRKVLTAAEFDEITPQVKKLLSDGIALKLFGIRDRATKKKEDSAYYIHKIRDILQKWDGSEVTAVEERQQVNGFRVRSYGLFMKASLEREFLALTHEDDSCLIMDE